MHLICQPEMDLWIDCFPFVSSLIDCHFYFRRSHICSGDFVLRQKNQFHLNLTFCMTNFFRQSNLLSNLFGKHFSFNSSMYFPISLELVDQSGEEKTFVNKFGKKEQWNASDFGVAESFNWINGKFSLWLIRHLSRQTRNLSFDSHSSIRRNRKFQRRKMKEFTIVNVLLALSTPSVSFYFRNRLRVMPCQHFGCEHCVTRLLLPVQHRNGNVKILMPKNTRKIP